MYLRRLELLDFRSYKKAEISLNPGVSVFLGDNGQGKTNLVEAAEYVATLSSHRTAHTAPLVRSGAPCAVIRALVVHETRELSVDLQLTPGKSVRAKLNRVELARSRQVLGALRLILFSPQDAAILRSDPSARRAFLDELVTARTPHLSGVRAEYERVLRQRNALLRTMRHARRSASHVGDAETTLRVFDQQLLTAAIPLTTARARISAELTPHVAEAYTQIAAEEVRASIEYRPTLWNGADLRDASLEERTQRAQEALVAVQSEERERGVSLIGPHRDELVCTLGELPVRGYASHGETWSFALALKLAAYTLLSADGGEPVLVLDDVFAELDAGRRARLAQRVGEVTQLLVTAADEGDVPASLKGEHFTVSQGTVSHGAVSHGTVTREGGS